MRSVKAAVLAPLVGGAAVIAVDVASRISLESRTARPRHFGHAKPLSTSRDSLPVSKGRHGMTGFFGKSAKTDKGNPACAV